MGDVLSYLIRPDGAYFPGFTITAALGGLIYGFFLYRRPISLPRTIVAKASISLLLNVLLNTFWTNDDLQTVGTKHVAFEVDNMAEMKERLLKNHVDIAHEVMMEGEKPT